MHKIIQKTIVANGFIVEEQMCKLSFGRWITCTIIPNQNKPRRKFKSIEMCIESFRSDLVINNTKCRRDARFRDNTLKLMFLFCSKPKIDGTWRFFRFRNTFTTISRAIRYDQHLKTNYNHLWTHKVVAIIIFSIV